MNLASNSIADVGPDRVDEPVRVISAKREFSAIAQRDRYGVEAGNIVKPAERSQMNSPAVPPASANGLASGDIRKAHFLADHAGSKRCAQSFILDRNFKSVEQNEADQQDDRNNYWRRVMAHESAASNQNDREERPNNYVTDLRVLVTRHRRLSASGRGIAACWNLSSDFTKFPGNGRTRSKIRAASGLAVV